MSPNFVVDSCLLIEYFRSKDKSTTWLVRLIREQRRMSLSTVVLFEVLSGADDSQRKFWKEFLQGAIRLPFDERTAEIAANLFRKLRQKRIRLESSDLFIAATALAHNLPLATLNYKHFESIDDLKLLLPKPDSQETG